MAADWWLAHKPRQGNVARGAFLLVVKEEATQGRGGVIVVKSPSGLTRLIKEGINA